MSFLKIPPRSIVALLMFGMLASGFALAQAAPNAIEATQVIFPPLANLPPVQSASVQVIGNPGPQTVYYWIVANYLLGQGPMAGPFVALNVPNSLSASNSVTIAPTYPSGVVSVDVLKTLSATAPTGACACAVATGVTSGTVSDQSNSTGAYSVAPVVLDNFELTLDNEVTGAGATHLILRQNGTQVADLSVPAGGGTLTSVATTSPITGGPITTSGAVACPTCTTSAASLTNNAVVLGAGSQVTQVSAGINTNGASELDVGVAGGATGVYGLKGSTSGICTDTVNATSTNVAWSCTLSGTGGSSANPTYGFSVAGYGFHQASSTAIGIDIGGSLNMAFDSATGLSINSGNWLGWTSTGDPTVAADLTLARGAANSVLNIGTGGNTFGKIKTAAYMSVGTTFTSSGGCTETALSGGATTGQFTSGTTGTCTTTLTWGNTSTAPAHWACQVLDQTTHTLGSVTSSTATTAVVSVATTSGDTVVIGPCTGY